ncbi:hypothetical protein M9Y10_004953 [Tritrichomonas musculus]|uniref:Uncharacterized protein n=1 Tax=Tritrichomonas musculus TaxID=1915356 RepID=A0ABR2JJY6_9EUKA
MNQKLNDLQELSDRVLNLHRRVCGARSNICDANSPLAPNNPGLYSSDTGDQQQNSIQITPAQIEFYDENWRDVIEHFKSNDKILCYQTLIDTLDKQLLSKADLVNLPEKADRQYVDYLISEITCESNKLLKEKLNSEFSGIRDQIEQSRADVTTMKVHFNTQIEALKKELTHYKRKLIDPTIDDEPVLVQERHGNHHPNKQAHSMPTSSNLPRIQKPSVFKDTYRPRTRPYIPQDLKPSIHSENIIPY